MSIEILYFAGARDAAGLQRESLADSCLTVAALRAKLLERHPKLGRILDRCKIAVNEEFAEETSLIQDRAVVAVVPPVSGGVGLFRVTDQPLSLDEVVRAVSSPGMGGIASFTGTVRDLTRGKRVLRLDYETYASMATSKLAAIGAEVGAEHGANVAIVHRVGVLEPGEAAVVIACAAPHRRPAFEACQAVIERLKKEVPIWKKEFLEDGSEWVGLGP
jgi:molybdopterin synthase catalytic subunit